MEDADVIRAPTLVVTSNSYRSKQVLFEKLVGSTGWDLRNTGRSVWGGNTQDLKVWKSTEFFSE